MTNDTIVPSAVTSSFQTQPTQEHHQQQQHQNQQVFAQLNGNTISGGGLAGVIANSNPTADMNSVALQRSLSIPNIDHSAEPLQSTNSNASAFPSYTGLTLPNQSE